MADSPNSDCCLRGTQLHFAQPHFTISALASSTSNSHVFTLFLPNNTHYSKTTIPRSGSNVKSNPFTHSYIQPYQQCPPST